ncbi:hypothetical protein [Parasphingorhabdus sp.]|uniref:hypothetical protein n=1 Tax=Parasphingorhabdus sp. TaxID=2709688 RepID=UPI003D275C59
MSMDRRQILTGVGIAAAVSVASSVSACSPAPIQNFGGNLPQSYFGLIASRKFDEADKLVSKDVKLSIVSSSAHNFFAGKDEVRNFLSNLLLTSGFRMIGDNPEYAMGGFWDTEGGWQKSDMIRGEMIEILDCGDQLFDPVLNVFVGTDSDNKLIANVLLFENLNLNIEFLPGNLNG